MTERFGPLTAVEFRRLPPYQKGYVVYMHGGDAAHPNVPEHYDPLPEEAAEYQRGRDQAAFDIQDAAD